MEASPTTEYLQKNINDLTTEQAMGAIKLLRSLPGGNKAIAQFRKTLQPQERKKMNAFFNTVLSPLDLLNTGLERGIKYLVSLLP